MKQHEYDATFRIKGPSARRVKDALLFAWASRFPDDTEISVSSLRVRRRAVPSRKARPSR